MVQFINTILPLTILPDLSHFHFRAGRPIVSSCHRLRWSHVNSEFRIAVFCAVKSRNDSKCLSHHHSEFRLKITTEYRFEATVIWREIAILFQIHGNPWTLLAGDAAAEAGGYGGWPRLKGRLCIAEFSRMCPGCFLKCRPCGTIKK